MSFPGSHILVYGYGNPGRGDDGLGPAFVEALELLGATDLDCESDYQLAIEDAASLAKYDVLARCMQIFDVIRCEPVEM